MNQATTSSLPAPIDAEQAPAALRALESTLHAGNWDEVAQRLPPLLACGLIPDGALDPAVRLLAQWHLNHARWGSAAEGFALLHGPTDTDQRQHVLARNLAVAERHRPEVCRALWEHRQRHPDQPYRFVKNEAGRVLLAQPGNGGGYTQVPPGDRFADFAKQTEATLADKPGYPLALLGLGDGYALTRLAERPPQLFMDQTQTVHVIEPDLDRVWITLHLHDWTDAALPDGGPWCDPRFRWHVGSDWETRFRAALDADPWTPPPSAAVCPDPTRAPEIGAKLGAVSAGLEQRTAEALAAMKSAYAHRDASGWVALLGDDPPRRPRVAVMTSRFTTVLQYAARDTAAALERLGCDVAFLIEEHRHQRFNAAVFTRLLRDFEPDLLLSIDATRHQLRGWVPDALPHLCWVQDALPQLMNEQLGRAIGKRDFILTFFAPRLTGDHAYPARQCIDMPMMLTSPTPEESLKAPTKTGPDLIYASNVSGTEGQLREQSIRRAPETVRALVDAAADVLIRHYAEGDPLPTEPDLDALLEHAVQTGELKQHDPDARRALRDALWNPLNTGLYRQQALGWVADAVTKRGLTLHVHGQGWADHPRFGAFDRGPLDHAALRDATAAARFALHLEPYICFTHHRMLDAMQSGTAVLVRDHPGHFGLQRVAAFVHEHCPGSNNDAEARERLASTPAQSEELDVLLRRYRGLTWDLAGDVVAQVRCWQRAGVLPDDTGALPALPDLDAVTFTDAAGFGALLDRWLAEPDALVALVEAQRGAVRSRLTFDAAFVRVLRRVGELLDGEARSA